MSIRWNENRGKYVVGYRYKWVAVLMMVVLLQGMLTGCGQETEVDSEEVSVSFFAMDTYMSLSATDPDVNAAELAISESQTFIEELEMLISRTEESSEIYELNHSNGAVVTVSDMTYEIISIALECAEKTGGVFDPTICTITDLWGIGSEDACVPDLEDIEEALGSVSYENIILLEENGVQLLNGAQIDLGAIGKGYAADALYDIYTEYEIEKGIIALSGNVYMVGEKAEDTPWSVGITDPDNTAEYNIGIQVVDKSVVTTGAYERYFEEDGVIYHHIFDTATGYPTDEDIKSVTVVSEYSTLADIYATALFAMGYEDAIAFAEAQEEIEVIIIREDDVVYVSDELVESITIDEKYTQE